MSLEESFPNREAVEPHNDRGGFVGVDGQSMEGMRPYRVRVYGKTVDTF